MTADEARDAFSAAYDGELDPAASAAFEAALAADAELRKEYEEFAAMLRETNALTLDEGEAPDLLEGVQSKIRVRSRGRFYRDRFSQRAGVGPLFPMIVGVVMLVLLGMAWLALQYSVVEAPTPRAQSSAPP